HRVLKPSGTFWLAIGDDFAAELKVAFGELGFRCRSWVVWYYTFGVNCTKKFSRSHTHLFHFVKNAKEFTFNANAIRVPSARQLVYDPFAGSGTTLVVARKLGRRWLGFELSSNYADQVRTRLAAIAEGDPLVGAEDPITSAPSTAEGKRCPVNPLKARA